MKMLKAISAATLMLLSAVPAFAQAWPERTVKWIVPYAAGGNSDGYSRAIAKKLAEALGQPVIIENKPGGDTIIGMTSLVQSPPDGYTIAFISDTLAIHAASNRNTRYDIEKDFAMIGQMALIPFTLVTSAEKVPARDLKEFIEYARKNPEAITFASMGPGSPHEMGYRWLQHFGNFKSTIVPYRGVAPALQDLLAGQVTSMFWGGVINDQWVKAGKIRRIAVSTGTRVDAAPEATPMGELYRDYQFVSWYGLAAPGGTPKAIIDRLNLELNKALASDEVRDLVKSYGFLPASGTPQQLSTILKSDVERYRRLLSQTGISLAQ